MSADHVTEHGSSAPAPRLFVLLASEAPRAVVIRRGPTEWVRLSLWHTDTDTFEHGQWLHGRVYERRCDLSPDGELLVSFIRKDDPKAPTDSWLCLSRPPFFSALAVWFVGGTWAVGGLFRGSREVWLGSGDVAPDRGSLPKRFRLSAERLEYLDRSIDWTDRTVHSSRLVREGWTFVRGSDAEHVWRRERPGGGPTLELTERLELTGYHARRVIGLALEHDGERLGLGDVDWGGWDQRGRLVVARGGRLLELQPDSLASTELCGFEEQTPEPDRAPSWAHVWPRSATSKSPRRRRA